MNTLRPSKKFAALLLLAAAVALPAQAVVSTQEILKRTLAIVGVAEDRGDQVLLCQIDHVRKDHTATLTYNLSAGTNYRIVAVGDDGRVADLDLSVYDSHGNLIGKDDDEKNVAVVSVRPRYDGRFKFTVKPYSMANGANDAFYSLMVVRVD